MANVRNSNTFYIDTQAADAAAGTAENLAVKNLKVHSLTYRPSNATNQIILKDVTSAAVKLNFSVATSLAAEHIVFQEPLVFPNGIAPTTLTAATATLVISQ